MNISWMTLRDLEYLVTTAQYLHFGKAAQSCHVSQPALSSQIKKFENRLGFRVFDRTNRRVALTERGKRVIEQARVVLEEAQKLVTDFDHGGTVVPQGTIRIGVIATLGPYYVPKFLPLLKKKYPRVQALLREGLTDGLLDGLNIGKLDVVLAARTFDETGFRLIPLFEEPFLLAVPKDHLLSRKKPLHSSDLRGEEMVLLEDGHCLRDQALDLCPRNRRGNIRQFHATSLETLRHLVASGMGYTLMPKLAVDSVNPMKDLLKYRDLEGDKIGRTIVLVCREHNPRIAEFEVLAQFLHENRPKL